MPLICRYFGWKTKGKALSRISAVILLKSKRHDCLESIHWRAKLHSVDPMIEQAKGWLPRFRPSPTVIHHRQINRTLFLSVGHYGKSQFVTMQRKNRLALAESRLRMPISDSPSALNSSLSPDQFAWQSNPAPENIIRQIICHYTVCDTQYN